MDLDRLRKYADSLLHQVGLTDYSCVVRHSDLHDVMIVDIGGEYLTEPYCRSDMFYLPDVITSMSCPEKTQIELEREVKEIVEDTAVNIYEFQILILSKSKN